MDCFSDVLCRTVLPRIRTDNRLVELVKFAELSPESRDLLPDAAFADRTRRELPVHTAGHAALSRLYLDHNPALPEDVRQEVREACVAFGIPEDLFVRQDVKTAAAQSPDDYLFPEERRISIRTAEEVQRAEVKLASEGHRLTPAHRVLAARRLRTKAAALGAGVSETTVRMAGDASTNGAVLVEQLEARATICKDAALAEQYRQLADAARGCDPSPEQQVRIATLLEVLDMDAKLPPRQGFLDPAATVFSGAVRKTASAADVDLGPERLTGGAAAQIDPRLIGDILGDEVMDEVAPDGRVNPQLLQQIMSTLPRDVKQAFAQQLRAAGVRL